MTDLFHSFDGIIADYEAALQTLTDVLDHIQRTSPDPKLRVVLLNHTIVALTSTIEEILRALFKEYLTTLENNFADYRLLRTDLQKANLGCAALELKSLRNADDFRTATAIISNLSLCMNGHVGYRLLKDKLVYNQRNFRSSQVTEISKNLGLPNLWSSLCDSPEIEVYTGEPNLDSRMNRLIAKWNELFDERDLVVHRVSQATGWAPERIRESLVLSRLVVKLISISLLKDAQQLIESKNRPASKTGMPSP